MKKILCLLMFLLNSSFIFSQNINKLRTFKQTAKFLKKHVNKKYTFKEVFDREKEFDEEDFTNYVKKIDINNDGYTDLIVDGYLSLIIVINEGNNKFKELKFENRKRSLENNPELDTIIKTGGEIVLVFKTKIYNFDEKIDSNVKFNIDSLTVKYRELVEYKMSKANSKIREVKFSTSGCFGTCPIFEIKLTSDRNLEYKGEEFTNYKGIKNLKLNQSNYNDLIGLLEYADLKHLKDHYSVNWTDDQAGTLKIIYENGDVKDIYDYGLFGTINLRVIYKKFFEINKNIK